MVTNKQDFLNMLERIVKDGENAGGKSIVKTVSVLHNVLAAKKLLKLYAEEDAATEKKTTTRKTTKSVG